MRRLPLAPDARSYPRPVTSIHQVEITSRCNLRCVYCPSPHLPRPKQDMTLGVFERCLEWARHFDALGTQGELSLTGIGEPTLHPLLVEFVRLARQALPSNLIHFSTNGLLLDDALCEQLAPFEPVVSVSMHRPEKAGPAIEAAKRWNLLGAVNCSAAMESFDWAGQVDWHVSARPVTCEYLRVGWAVVLADGRVTTCCLDASGAGVVGHIDDDIGSLAVAPYSLCSSCHMKVPAVAREAVAA